MNPALVEQIKKELESVPWTCGATVNHRAHVKCQPDYQALAEKVAGWVEVLQGKLTADDLGGFKVVWDEEALAALPWRTDAP